MKTFTYTSYNQSLSDVVEEDFTCYANVLVQIFCGEGKERLLWYAKEMVRLLPQAHIIGTTTDGEIEQDRITTVQTVVAISVFEETTIRSGYVDGSNAFENGVLLAKQLLEENSKLLILFSDGTTCNGEAFLKGIESVDASVKIAGGMAGDNGRFLQTYVLHQERLISHGGVGVSLNSDILHVQNHFSFNWTPIGIEHVVDKVENNRVYQIDGISAVDFYAKYLGEEVADALPATGIEFPLIVEKDGFKIARAVIAKHPDNSLSFAGNLLCGDRVRLGFGNAELILKESLAAFAYRYSYPVESFFIYSCMARRRYMPEFIQIEIKPYSKYATTTGFFTYGEFYHHNNKNSLLNQTLTVVALSEALYAKQFPVSTSLPGFSKEHSDYVTTIKALTHLIARSTLDYEVQAKKLEEEKRYSQKLLSSQRLFLRHAVHESNTPLSVMMSNIELFELEFGKHPYLANIEAALKNLYGIYDDLGYLVKKDQIAYPRQRIELVDYVRSRIEFFDIVAQQLNLSFVFEAGCEEIYVLINETKLQRIVDNNITNALKYTHEGEPILVVVDQREEGVYFEISSRSIRIEDPSKVFEAYYREIETKEGLGIGLNLVRRICEEEGIEIFLDSNHQKTIFGYLFQRDDGE